jgi:hypothetical protein
MKQKESGVSVLSPDQVVAWNLERIRRERGWSQSEAAQALAPYLGHRLSRAAFSQAERSLYSRKIRRFDADEIVAFCRAFEVPVPYFFGPPEPHFRGKPVMVNGKPGHPRARIDSPPLSRDDMLAVAQGRPDQAILSVISQVAAKEMHDALAEGIYRYLIDHPEQLSQALSGNIPAEFWERMRKERKTVTTAIREKRLADKALESLKKARSSRRHKGGRQSGTKRGQ